MATIDVEFREICRAILDNGVEYENKNRGVKRLQIPSYTFRHSFRDGFPAITNKKLYWKGVATELIWFLRGDTDVKYLNSHGVKIWNKDAYNWHKKNQDKWNLGLISEEAFSELGKGSVGQNYSAQWRNYNGEVDQILNLINDMKSDIMSSRLKVNAWNPAEINETALPPCHSEFQVIGVPLPGGKFGFELHWNQRSVDTFLGLPVNIASYALLAKILERLTGFEALGIEGTLKCVHFYDNQYGAAVELMARDAHSHPNCQLRIDDAMYGTPDGNIIGSAWDKQCDTPDGLDSIMYCLEPEHFQLVGYSSDAPIKVEMLAPKEI